MFKWNAIVLFMAALVIFLIGLIVGISTRSEVFAPDQQNDLMTFTSLYLLVTDDGHEVPSMHPANGIKSQFNFESGMYVLTLEVSFRDKKRLSVYENGKVVAYSTQSDLSLLGYEMVVIDRSKFEHIARILIK
jgi:hypothetical protein